MRRSFQMLSDANKNVVVVLDNPTLPFEPSACSTRPFRITAKDDGCAFPRDVYDKDGVYVAYKEIVQRVANDFSNVQIIDLSSQLCDRDRCYVAKSGKVLYKDINHLSFFGSQYVAPYILKSLVAQEKN